MSNIIEFSHEPISVIHLEILTPRIAVGDNLEFTFTLQNTSALPVQADIQYELTCQTAGGDKISSIYKLSNRLCPKGFLLFNQTQRLNLDTFQTILPGRQQLSILINQRRLKTIYFETVISL